ncbi:hypothetical protein B0H21DRAFT_826957 [Amylocystis lapponica]|nr:hypothetical protein B0H21DRAFT_826957 [Amylocystis lapponica]
MGLFSNAALALLLAAAVTKAQTVGTLFYFTPGVGACGFTNTSDQYVASVSNATFWAFPGANSDPNDNPICAHNVTVTSGAVSVTAPVVDYCPSCAADWVGLSPVGFEEFAPTGQGVVSNVTWLVN